MRSTGLGLRGPKQRAPGLDLAVINRTYPLAQTAAAVQYLQEGHTQGKVVIAVR